MPRLLRLSAVTLLLPPVLATVACSSLPKAGSDGVFRESAADVVNRAPQSMSVPSDGRKALDARTQADYHFALAETYSLEGDSTRAIEEYKLTLVYDPASPAVMVNLAAEYLKQGLVSEAMEQAKGALQKDPNFIEAHILLGGLYSALRMYDDALAAYRAVLATQPDNGEAPLFIGALLAEQKKYGEAAIQFEKLAKDPNNTNAHVAWYYLGRVRLEEDRKKNAPKAESAFQQALASKSSYPEATLALGQLFEETGRPEKTTKLYQAYQEKHGPSSAVAEELSRIYIEAKDYKRAFEQLAIMEANEPQDVNIKAKMAFILIEQEKYQEAITRLEDVLALEPSSDKIRFYLGAVYEQVKDYKAAITHFQKVPFGSSYYTEAVVHASYLYKVLADYPKAIDAIQEGIKNKDDHPPFYALYASLLDEQKQYKQAATMLGAATERFPDNAQLHFFLGNMHEKLGDKDATITSMRKVLALDKDHVQALNFLAYIFAEESKNLDEAETLVRRAIELQPEDGFILDTYGWVLFRRGKYREAVRILEAAYKIQPNEAVIAEHLGDAYYHQQMPEKAKKLYMRAAEMESNAATVEKIRAKIYAVDRQIQKIDLDESDRKPASAKSR